MLEIGRQVDRYTLEAPIGAGGQGYVYRVRHIQLGTDHALKVVSGGGARMRDRLLQEGRAQARLRHPNIVSVTDVIDVDGNSGLIMEFVPGPPLSVLIAQERLSFDQIDLLARGILDGVSFAHRQRFIHRDLKPDNILCAVTERGLVPKIMDFGLVKALSGAQVPTTGMRQTRSGAMMGTAQYMSPEQVRSTKDVDERSDVWALGVILYEMITGALPFDNEDVFEIFSAVTSGEYVPLENLRSDVPERMAEAVTRAIVVDPDERLSSVEALLEVWTRGSEGAPPVGPPSAAAWDAATLERYTVRSLPSFEPTGQHETWMPSMDQDAHSTWRTTDAPAAADAREDTRRRGGLLIGAGLLLGLGGLLLFGGLGVWFAAQNGAGGVAAESEAEPTLPAPTASEPPSEPAPEPKPVAPTEPSPVAAVEPVPAPKPAPKPVPAPELIVAAPAPKPVPTEKPAPLPQPEPVGPTLGTFSVRGRVLADDKVYLSPIDGGRPIHKGGQVPAGTYSVIFVVDGTSHGTGQVTVAEGQSVKATCDRDSDHCRTDAD